jgi:peroxiredoxin Q/BCP
MNYGRKYMGVLRTTYIIDPEGRVAQVFEKVKPENHGEQVAEALNVLSKAPRSR